MEECTIKNLYNLDKTIAKELLEGHKYPWEILSEIEEYIISLGNTLDENYEKKDDNIWIHKSSIIFPSAYIEGPCIICKDAKIRQAAFIRGKAIIGDGATVGNSTEIKNSILFDNVEVPHFNYVGDSILGYKAHLGAGAVTSNIKSDRQNVVIKNNEEQIETGLRKIGAMLGDNVEVGCHAVLNPGTIVGKNTNIYPQSFVRGVIPADSILKNTGQIVKKEERPKTKILK